MFRKLYISVLIYKGVVAPRSLALELELPLISGAVLTNTSFTFYLATETDPLSKSSVYVMSFRLCETVGGGRCPKTNYSEVW